MKVARLSVVVHRAVGLAAGSLLILVLHGSPIERVRADGTPQPSGKLIRVWSVGSPFRGDLPQVAVPADLQRQAEKLGYTIEVETFPAAGISGRFRQALQDHNEPEVLTFDNYGVVMGVRTPTGWLEGVASDGQAFSSFVMVHEAFAPLQPRGWVMLVRSAANYEAARVLSMQPPVCGAESALADQLLAQTELPQSQETAAVVAARAYLACDHASLNAISDESRLGQKCFLPESDTQVDGVKACSVSGNHNLAFVSLVSTFAAQLRAPRYYPGALPSMDLGHQSILAVLRNQGGAWRLLAITADPLDTVATIPLTTQRVGGLLDDGRTAGAAPDPARLLTPDGAYPRPAQGERFGDFTWRPSQSADVIGQVVEFMFGDNSDRGRTRLFFPDAREGKLSSGYLMSGGTTSWRVWSISKGGEVAFSEQRSYRH